MNCDVTLSASDFKKIHNALCSLDDSVSRIGGVVNSGLLKNLTEAISSIRSGLKSAYDQEENDFNRKSEHYDLVSTSLGLKAKWSMYEVENLNTKHPYTGVSSVIYRDHWGEDEVRVDIDGDSWAALFKAADKAITLSGDEHHVFIEDFTRKNDCLVLSTGS